MFAAHQDSTPVVAAAAGEASTNPRRTETKRGLAGVLTDATNSPPQAKRRHKPEPPGSSASDASRLVERVGSPQNSSAFMTLDDSYSNLHSRFAHLGHLEVHLGTQAIQAAMIDSRAKDRAHHARHYHISLEGRREGECGATF